MGPKLLQENQVISSASFLPKERARRQEEEFGCAIAGGFEKACDGSTSGLKIDIGRLTSRFYPKVRLLEIKL